MSYIDITALNIMGNINTGLIYISYQNNQAKHQIS